MPEQLFFTAILNRFFACPVDSLLNGLGIHPTYPQAPIPNSLAMELLVVVILFALFFFVRARLSVDEPGATQHIFEGLHGFITGQSEEIIGHHSDRFTPFLAGLFVFILVSNLIGLVPGLESPTATPPVALGCALLAFVYYHVAGIRRQGPLKYAKHFAGPLPWLAPLMIPIEIISHLARVMSLTIRLFANMFAGDLVTLVFFSLVPIALPVVFLGLHLFVSLLQAYIFVLLTTVYLAGAVAEEH